MSIVVLSQFSLTLFVGHVRILEVAVRERDQPPDDGEREPRQKEAERKGQQCPAPLRVDQGREYVLQEPQPSAVQLRLKHITVAVLEDRPAPEPL